MHVYFKEWWGVGWRWGRVVVFFFPVLGNICTSVYVCVQVCVCVCVCVHNYYTAVRMYTTYYTDETLCMYTNYYTDETLCM